MNYDWTAASPGGGTPGGGTPGGGIPVGGATTNAPVSFKSKTLRLKKGKVSFRLACTSATACKGKARLRTRATKPKTLASKSLTIAGGKTKTITFKLSNKARKSVHKKSTKVTLEVDLGSGGKATKNLKLKR